MAISINFTKTVDNAVDLSQKKTYINGAFTSASDIANFPTVGIATGSELVNVGGGNDTGKKYVFTGTGWNLMPSDSGGSGLPSVTSDDNGKKLYVVGGEWRTKYDTEVRLRVNLTLTQNYEITLGDSTDGIALTYIPTAFASGTGVEVFISDTHSNRNCITVLYPSAQLENLYDGIEYTFTGSCRYYYTSASGTNVEAICNVSITFEFRDNSFYQIINATAKFNGDYIVTLYPTNPDFSGSMDKTWEEVYFAYLAGFRVVANVYGTNSYAVASGVNDNGVMFDVIMTLPTGDLALVHAESNAGAGTGASVYTTKVFPLTPLSVQ